MIPLRIIYICVVAVLLCALQNCNYHYHQGLKLEKKERYEEANIEYRQAYIESPNNSKFAEAFRRTAVKTSESFLKRYERYLKEKKYSQAFKVLGQAAELTPQNLRIKTETKKWFRVLLSGKIKLTDISSLSRQIPLTEKLSLEIHFNTSDASRKLESVINYRTGIFKVEDVLYDPSSTKLMSYSINSIGVKLLKHSTGQAKFRKFIDFKAPVLIGVQGYLKENGGRLSRVESFSPLVSQQTREDDASAYSHSVGEKIIYYLTLDGYTIKADTSLKHIKFLPRTLYANKKDRRYFLDFGHLEISRKKAGGFWTLKRLNYPAASYLKDLQKYIILTPYFYFREGAYPFVSIRDGG